jgi:hypothetical protein
MQKLKAIAAATAVATTIIGGGASMASADTAHSGDTLSSLYPDSWRYVCIVNIAEGRIPDCDTLITGQEIRGQVSAQEQHNIDVWFANVPHQPVVADANDVATSSPASQSTQQTSADQPQQQPVYSGGGGGCVPDYIVQRESGGDYKAENPTSTASGKYQFLDGTWNGYGGYQHASDAPPAVQDAKACEVWDNGGGASHWAVP